MDITDAVIDASGASARAAEYISASSGNRSPVPNPDNGRIPGAGLEHE
jgi:hypothetical protein